MKKRTWRKRGMGRNTVRHIDKHTARKKRKKERKKEKKPSENEIFPLTIKN